MVIILKLVARICSEVYNYRRVIVVRLSETLGVTRERTPEYSDAPPPFTVGLSLFVPVIASLFAIGMLVAPLPVVSLVSGSLVVVRAVISMAFLQVAPVCPIFAVIPIMIIAMVRIIDSQLNARILRARCCHDRRGHKNSSSQHQRTDKAMYA